MSLLSDNVALFFIRTTQPKHFKIIMSCFRVLPSARAEAHARQNRRTPKGNFRCTTNFDLDVILPWVWTSQMMRLLPGTNLAHRGDADDMVVGCWCEYTCGTIQDTQKGLQQPDKCGNPIPPWVNFCFYNFKIFQISTFFKVRNFK